MSWKNRFPKIYRALASARMALASQEIIELPFGARMRISPFHYVERLIAEGEFEKRRADFFENLITERTSFFDIGTNVGFYTLLAAAGGATVHSFEPEPMNLSRLRANLSLNPELSARTTVWPVALGNRGGVVEFGRPLSDNYGRATLLPDDSFERIQVRMERFDHLACQSTSERIFKIDVEGAEQLVLEGFGRAWDVAVPTVFLVEVHRQGGADLVAITEEFRSRDFRVSYLDDDTGEENQAPPDRGDVALVARRD